MVLSTISRAVVRFDVFEVDLQAAELKKHGRKVKLQDQPFRLLAMLLKHPGAVVIREEMRQKLWPADTFVDFEHGLNSAVARLRETLNDSAERPRFVETLPRRGYRSRSYHWSRCTDRLAGKYIDVWFDGSPLNV